MVDCRNSRQKKMIWIAAAVLWMAAIFAFSAKPAKESNHMSLTVGRTVGRIVVSDFHLKSKAEQDAFAKQINYGVRKAAHGTEYAVLGMLLVQLFLCFEMERKRCVLYSVLVGIAYAISDEVHQLFVPGRSCQMKDVMIDSAGVVAGVLIILAISKVWKNRNGS